MSQVQRQVPPPPPIRVRKTKTQRLAAVAKKHPRPIRHKSKLPIRRELSAGGVAVRLERGQWLAALLKTEHKRGQVWVLPKGHVEANTNEGVSDAARREVQEEAGLKDLSVRDQLGITRFTFQAEDAVVRKTVHYFLMVTGQKELTPQAEEGLLEAAWFPLDVAIKQLEYDTDQEIVQRAKEKLLGLPRQPFAAPQKTGQRRTVRIRT